MAITSQRGLDDADGILGLSPNIPENGPSFVQALGDQDIKEKKLISFVLGTDSSTSKMTFGGYDDLVKNSGSDIQWH